MNKFLLALLLSASLAFAYSGGDGSYENPYQIASPDDWFELCGDVNVGGNTQSGIYFIQTADIVFEEGYPWQMYRCGNPDTPFKGSYDGDGYYFSNLFITDTVASTATTNAFGLFGYCENATIENVKVQGKIEVSADYNGNACVGVGGVIGLAVKGLYASLHNYVDIDVKISGATTGQSSASNIKYGVGGVLGLNAWTTNGGTTHIGCENYGNIYVDGANGACAVGGCFSANIPNSGTDTTFSGWNNYGKVVVNGTDESSMSNSAIASGIGAIHGYLAYGVSRIPKFVGCSNFGNIISSNCVHISGICSNGRAESSSAISATYSTNYADIVSVATSVNAPRLYIAGIICGVDRGYDNIARYCVNFGKIKAFGNGTSFPQIGGIYSCMNATTSFDTGFSYDNKNLGALEADCPNASSVIVGGVAASYFSASFRRSENFGNISVNTDGSVLIGGVLSMASAGNKLARCSDCVNLGSIVANGNSNTNYSPCVGGVFASTRLTDSNTKNITLSNCYFIGTAKLNLNADNCYGAIYGVANTYGSYSVSIKNCYAVVGEGENLIGAVDASNGNVSLENCVGIKSGREGGVAYSVSGSNNWSQTGTQIVSYEDCYTSPFYCLGNISSGIFFPAEKSTNYYDLILPINTKLYSTPSAEDKKNHNYTKAQGYKRYVKTNRK